MKPKALKLKWAKDIVKDEQRENYMDEIRLEEKEKKQCSKHINAKGAEGDTNRV